MSDSDFEVPRSQSGRKKRAPAKAPVKRSGGASVKRKKVASVVLNEGAIEQGGEDEEEEEEKEMTYNWEDGDSDEEEVPTPPKATSKKAASKKKAAAAAAAAAAAPAKAPTTVKVAATAVDLSNDDSDFEDAPPSLTKGKGKGRNQRGSAAAQTEGEGEGEGMQEATTQRDTSIPPEHLVSGQGSLSYVVELAKSSRAECRQCDSLIAKGEPRVGLQTDNDWDLYTRWQHLACTFFQVPAQIVLIPTQSSTPSYVTLCILILSLSLTRAPSHSSRAPLVRSRTSWMRWHFPGSSHCLLPCRRPCWLEWRPRSTSKILTR